ncbi:MAG: hypothetical protein JO117_00800, partial [Verrucomicrobia bacterium]|nr:hypothetical protein [Verrucomicrobiota bacterium]
FYSFGVALYNWIQRTAPWMHHGYFNFLEFTAPCRSGHKILGASRFRAILDHVRPHVILSTHGSLNHGFFELARDHLGPDRVRCVIYCGELFGKYGFSRHWVNPDADLFLGAVPETLAMARSLGMPAERTALGGFLLNPSFYEPPIPAEARAGFLREALGLDPARLTLLLSTSEHGAHNHPALLESLYAARRWLDLDQFQVIALCGRHPETLRRVRNWGYAHPALSLRALPRTERMALFMQAADAIVARPGTGTTSEAIISACPLIFNGLGGVMPQEWITVKFARRHRIADELHQPTDLPTVLARHLATPEHLRGVRERMIDVRPRAHPTDILRRVYELGAPLLSHHHSAVAATPSAEARKITREPRRKPNNLAEPRQILG